MSLRRRRGGEVAAVFSRPGLAHQRGQPPLVVAGRAAHRVDPTTSSSAPSTTPGSTSRPTPARSTSTRAAPWQVIELDPDARRVIVTPDRRRHLHAGPLRRRRIRILDDEAAAIGGRSRAAPRRRSRSPTSVTGYQVKRVSDHHTLDRVELDLPATAPRDPWRSGTRSTTTLISRGRHRRARPRRQRCTRSSTPASASSRCSPSATAGTSAASRPSGSPTPTQPTIVIYDALRRRGRHRRAGVGDRRPPPRRDARHHRAVRLRHGLSRRACSRRSAATGTNRSTRPAPPGLLRTTLHRR